MRISKLIEIIYLVRNFFMFSYWEQQAFFYYDILVIGSGIVGLSTAISLKEKMPSVNVAVLERGIFPLGASTRNAGFACIGSFTEILDDLQYLPEDKVLELIKMRRHGLRLLRKRLGDETIDYHENGSYELIGEKQIFLLDQLEKINQLLNPVLERNAFVLMNKRINEFGFNNKKIKALIQNQFEGELHTGKMMNGLIRKAMQMGIEIKNGCKVDKIEEMVDGVKVILNDAIPGDQFILHAGKIAVCTNAFTKNLFPEIDLNPGCGQVLITEPLSDLPFKGIFHFDQGYYYFREINNRILFGGVKNLDFERETTTEPALNNQIQKDLEEKLKTIILPGKKVKIDHRWAGIMAFGSEKFPIIKPYSHRIFLGVRMGGMGIAISSEVGERLAEMMVN